MRHGVTWTGEGEVFIEEIGHRHQSRISTFDLYRVGELAMDYLFVKGSVKSQSQSYHMACLYQLHRVMVSAELSSPSSKNLLLSKPDRLQDSRGSKPRDSLRRHVCARFDQASR